MVSLSRIFCHLSRAINNAMDALKRIFKKIISLWVRDETELRKIKKDLEKDVDPYIYK